MIRLPSAIPLNIIIMIIHFAQPASNRRALPMSHEMKGALPSRLFLALLSFRLCVAAGPSIAGHAWHPVTKPSSQNAPLQNVVTRSKIQCAGAANQKQDVSLFCYTDGGHCSLFGVPAKSFYDPAVDGETGPCWSRDPPPPSTTSSTATSTSTTAGTSLYKMTRNAGYYYLRDL